ncbi:polysaccharide deacetylase family protein [Thioalkalivibrio sp. XN8]|uniref:polysaccharide deacetylase family protein n=1 Tax=Thioalkalivibrio sp. XN8 TaxID=2712863 RepID=UPI0013EE1D59|nr:polysaccharide deacetylase family protein [Thioalkalivibrio sp. XN8]NGP53713.1 polysaccharide deacetylase family protein [Thioalkalivibrio sp. XN8]
MASVLAESRQSIKHGIRGLLDLGAAATGLLQWHERRARSGLTILMYHRVLPAEACTDYPLASLVMPVDAFAQQVAWLARRCRVRPVAEALVELHCPAGDPRPLVAITFDDGYADNFEHAAPILEAAGLRATFFVATGFVETGAPFWFDRAADAWSRLTEQDRAGLFEEVAPGAELTPGLASWMSALKRLPVAERDRGVAAAMERAPGAFPNEQYAPMTPAQVAELAGRGHEIASHGIDHPILPLVDDDELKRELTESRARLAKWTGREITGFCFPNGDSDPRVAAATAGAGYAYGCSTEEGINEPSGDPFRLRRRPVSMQRVFGPTGRHSILGFRAEVTGQRERWR